VLFETPAWRATSIMLIFDFFMSFGNVPKNHCIMELSI